MESLAGTEGLTNRHVELDGIAGIGKERLVWDGNDATEALDDGFWRECF